MVILGAVLVGSEPQGGPLGLHMADLGCQDREWVGGNDIADLDAILQRGGLILATSSMGKRKCGNLGSILGWFEWGP